MKFGSVLQPNLKRDFVIRLFDGLSRSLKFDAKQVSSRSFYKMG